MAHAREVQCILLLQMFPLRVAVGNVKWLFSLPVQAEVEEISFSTLRFSVSAS